MVLNIFSLNFGYFAIKGQTANSKQYQFTEEPKDVINMLGVSDIHRNKVVVKTINNFEGTPNIIAFLGDISKDSIQSKSVFVSQIIKQAADYSHGIIPVIYVKGNHECRGQFGPNIIRYLPTPTDEMYFTFDYGFISFVVLDTGEDKEDEHAEYSGCVDFQNYRNQQLQWLNSLSPGTQKIRCGLAHIREIDNHFGNNWITAMVNSFQANLFVTGHTHNVQLDLISGLLTKSVGGDTDEPSFKASFLTFTRDQIHFLSKNDSNVIIKDDTVDI